MKKIIFAATLAAGISFVGNASATTVNVETYSYYHGWFIHKETPPPVDVYADGKKVASEISCPRATPCAIDVGNAKSVTLCFTNIDDDCQTVTLDNAPVQRVAIMGKANGFWPVIKAYGPSTIFNLDRMWLKEYPEDKPTE